ncbi:hypothetical protein [Olleya sp. HaHaR_3_96]|uniref:hypothetical protein n=1 Tax=Olleya sp. HaHaR_3_96 TaxID=2745560 RepID=UPI001C4F38FF|nr:hypothetical protein [Olleya sp. HaHaR_3_96]QXP58274.1 hypothetical protein H0I26_10100 [Olleya sp. HaHaR_3_96]
MPEIERYYIKTEGNDDEAYKEAMQFACELVKKGMNADTVILLASTKKSVGWLDRIFDAQTVKKMFNGTKFNDCIPTFLIKTVKTYSSFSASNDIVITMGLNAEDIMKIDNYQDIKAIIAIPWLLENTNNWIKTWSPTELRTNEKPESFPEPNPIVKTALEELSKGINMSTGISNSFDNNRAKTYIRALYKYSDINGDVVKSYLVRELNWESDNADDMKKLIDTINSGKYFKGGDKTYLKNHIKRWEEK